MKNKLSAISLIVISVTIIIAVFKYPQSNIFAYDNFGFYMHLPNTFVYHDITLKDISIIEQINNKYNLTPTFYQLDRLENGNTIDRFFMGISILILPFFFIGHIIALIFGYNIDGYSEPYQWAIIFSGIFYAITGFFFLRKIILKFLNDLSASVTLIVFFYGTNIFFFSTLGNPFPHVYLFTLYALLIYYTILWHENHKIKYACIIGLVLGLLIVSRPSEIISIFIPLLWGIKDKKSLVEKWELLKNEKKQLFYVFLFTFIAGLPQIIYWLIVAHKPVYFPYTDPQSGLNFLGPRFAWVLFSYRKGWFVYSPLMLLAISGLILLYKKQKRIFFSVFVYLFLNLYLIACFSSLVSYGYRAFIQSYAILIIPFGFCIDFLINQKRWIKGIAAIILIGFFIINIFQAWQIKMGILHGSRTTRDYYRAVFMKKRIDPEHYDLLLIERSYDGVDVFKNEKKYNKHTLLNLSFDNPEKGKEKHYDTNYVCTGSYSLRMDSSFIYSPGLQIKYKDITNKYYAWIRASVNVYPLTPLEQSEALLVVAFTHNGKNYKYRTASILNEKYNVELNKWNKISIDYLTPEVRSKNDKLTVYIWYRGKKEIYIDDLVVESFTLD